MAHKLMGHNMYMARTTFQYRNPVWIWKWIDRHLNISHERCGAYVETYELIEEIRY